MHHGHHEPAGKSVAVEQRDRGLRVSQQAVPERVQGVGNVCAGEPRVLDVHAVGVEFGDRGRRDDHAARVAVLEDVEGEDESAAEGLGDDSWVIVIIIIATLSFVVLPFRITHILMIL